MSMCVCVCSINDLHGVGCMRIHEVIVMLDINVISWGIHLYMFYIHIKSMHSIIILYSMYRTCYTV